MLTSRYRSLPVFGLFLIFAAVLGSFLLGFPYGVSNAAVKTTISTTPNFTGPVYYDTGGVPTNNGGQPILGDFNGDSKPDIAVANYDSSNFAILFGNGNGTFQASITTTTSARPLGLAAGDFNGDGKLDLFITHFTVMDGVNAVYPIDVFLGDGAGHFTLAHTYTSGRNTMFAVAIDINKDGKQDIVVDNNGGGTMSVLLGNGDGSFQNAINTPSASPNPGDFVVVDFNGDGKYDLGIEDGPDLISFFMGNGDGTFQSPTSYPAGKSAYKIKAADFNGDGKIDLVGGLEPPNYTFVLLNNGDGTFNPISTSNSNNTITHYIGLADFTGDNKPDVAWVHGSSGTTQLKILAGVGNGTFQSVFDCTINGQIFDLVVGDLNGDGKPDIVLSNTGINKVTVILSGGKPSLSISNSSKLEGNSGTSSMVFTATMTSSCCQTVTVNYATADGTATTADNDYTATSGTLTFAPGETSKPITVTIKGDTKLEPDETFLVNLTSPTNATIGTGQATGKILNDDATPVFFKSPAYYDTGGVSTAMGSVPTIGDFNGDGKPDIAVTNYQNSNFGVLLNNGDGTFQAPITTTTSVNAFGTANGDFNGDGKLDLVVTHYSIFSNGVYPVDIFLGDGTGHFTLAHSYTAGSNPAYAEVLDLNKDGKLDIVICNNGGGSISVFLGNGDGSFQSAITTATTGASPGQFTTGDFNGDGKLDVAINEESNNKISVLLGNGDGSFQSPTSYSFGNSPTTVETSDLNGDGKLDLVVALDGPTFNYVLLGNGDGTFTPISTNNPNSANNYVFSLSDFNGDNKADLAWFGRGSTTTQFRLLSGLGDGTFQDVFDCVIDGKAYVSTAGDLNGDGKPDIVLSNLNIGKVTVILSGSAPSLSISDSSKVEGNNGTSSMVFTATMTSSCCQTVTVNYATADGTATTADNDYTAISGTLTFAPGETSKPITVTIKGDTKIEPDETFSVNLTSPTNATIGRAQATGTIINDDAIPVISINSVSQNEGNSGTTPIKFTVSLSSPSSQPVTVTYQTGDDTATVADNDYQATSGNLTFNPGEITHTVTVLINGDTKAEADETFKVTLSNPVNATLNPNLSVGTGTILNDEGCPGSQVSSQTKAGPVAKSAPQLSGTPPVNFRPVYDAGNTYPTGCIPNAVAAADFNGDNKVDLVTANSTGNNISILLGNGDGTFQLYSNIATGGTAFHVATADLNGDSKADIVVVNRYSPSNVKVMLGNGDGTFQTPTTLITGYDPVFVLIVYLNKDNKLDLVVNNGGAAYMNVYLGNGDGTFQPSLYASVSEHNITVAAADFNGDGNIDLATPQDYPTGQVSILLGNGDGTFQAPTSYPTSLGASGVVIDDFNKDGKKDLVVGNGNNTISLLLGNGDGTFQAAVSFSGATAAARPTGGDFNGDGNPDIATASGLSTEISVFLGTGTGSFQPPVSYTVGHVPFYVIAKDLNGDSKLDLAVANSQDSTVQILIGQGDGTFGNNYKTGNGPSAVVIGDFNGDHKDDLITTNVYANNLSLFLGRGDGSFQKAINFNSANTYPFHLDAADLNGDGKLDLVVVNRYNNTANLSIFLGNGDGTFQAPTNLNAEYDTVFVLIKDVNGDGKLDLVAANDGGLDLNLFLGNGNGTFQPATNINLGYYFISVVAGDFNGDGKVDLAAIRGYPSGSVAVLIGNGNGTFQAPVAYPIPSNASLAVVGDFNKDSKSDLVVADGDSNNLSMLIGNGDGTFQNAVNTTALTGSGRLVAGDFNGDGNLDVAVAGGTQGKVVSVVLGTGTGTFQTPITFPVGTTSFYVATKDLNGDGKLDLAVVNGADNTLSILLNTSPYYAVILPTDNGDITLDGSLSKALDQATTGQNIVFALPSNGTVVNVTHTLPAPKPGVTIVGSCLSNGPGITIQGNGVTGNGLVLNGGVKLWGIKVTGFNGSQIKLNSTNGPNQLSCVKIGG